MEQKRHYNIDFIKGLAIIAVIIQHTLTTDTLLLFGSPLHIFQQVPIFMILTGINSTQSYERRNFSSFQDFYQPEYMQQKFKRILIPFTIVWTLQIIIKIINKSDINLLRSYLSGGFGPGSYYVPLMVQGFLILPLIYLLCKKYPKASVPIMFAISLLLESLSVEFGMSEELYRLVIIRHVFALTLGVWLALHYKSLHVRKLIPLALISLIYILLVEYGGAIFMNEYFWRSQHAPSYFWPMLLVVIALKSPSVSKDNVINTLGQASYHIYLTQMFYFWFIRDFIPAYNGLIDTIVDIIISVVIGVTFYKIEQTIRQANKKHLQAL